MSAKENVEDLEKRTHTSGRWRQLAEFLMSQPDEVAVEVPLKTGETAKQAVNSGRAALLRVHGGVVKLVLRRDRVFAFRKGKD